METRLQLGSLNLQLKRLPVRQRDLLRAWDAADEYLLEYLSTEIQLPTQAKILIFNDSFGALAVGLHAYQPCAVSDSYLSQTATRLNLAANNIPLQHVSLLTSVEPLRGQFDWVLIKAPKTLAFLEDFLIRLQPALHEHTHIIVAGMVKNLSANIWSLLEKLIGKTTTSLARKKARLIFVQPNPERLIPANPYPVCYQLENTAYQICNHANVFSRDSLDIGTRFLLAHLPLIAEAKNIVDLGCGNGVVGLLLAEKHPNATIHFVDESFMAIASAKQNFQRAFAADHRAEFHIGDGLTAFPSNSMDLIVCNPPFHQQQTIGDQIALSMFQHSRRVLKNGAQLWVIGNRHLGYHQDLKKLFGQVALVASNAKFVVLRVEKET